LKADALLELPAQAGGTRCRALVYEPGRRPLRPVVVLVEIADNTGVPIACVTPLLAEQAVAMRLIRSVSDSLLFEVSWAKGVAAIVRGRRFVGAVTAIDTTTSPWTRRPASTAVLARLTGHRLQPPAHE
jgi:hypothetical protein